MRFLQRCFSKRKNGSPSTEFLRWSIFDITPVLKYFRS